MGRMDPFRTATPRPIIDLEGKDGHGPRLDMGTAKLGRRDLITHRGKHTNTTIIYL